MDLVELESGASVRRHPWEEARLAFFLRVLRGAELLRSDLAVLDVGAGDGFFARRLAAELPPGSSVTCWDANYTDEHLGSAAFAPSDRLRFTRAAPGDAFGLALLLDVLEHVEDDRGFLSAVIGERLVPGAHVLVSVPAWPALFSRHDVALRHYRRYTPGAARALLAGAGLEVVRAGGLFHALVPPRAAQVALERVRPATAPPADLGEWRAPAPVTALVRGALSVDASLSLLLSRLGIDLPGLSWWALCRKR